MIKLHPDIAEQVQNVRRRDFAQLENEYDIRIEIVASKDMSRGEESIEWLTKRQESELHPEALVSVAATDAASIIDVAEAYQAQETESDCYRPNDFEEYSSEDARRRRAAKRANRKELAAQPDAEIAEPTKSEPKPKAEPKSVESPASPAHSYAPGFITLAALVELLHNVLVAADKKNAEEKRPRRRFTFKSRHHAKKQEESGIRSDLRLFATDIVNAVSAIERSESESNESLSLADRIKNAKNWLLERARESELNCENNAKNLLEQISSRHAFARVSTLFNIGEHTQPDVLTQLLIAQCAAVYSDGKVLAERAPNSSKRRFSSSLNANRLTNLYNNLREQLQTIFGDDAVIATFTEDVDAGENEVKAAAPQRVDADAREPEIEIPVDITADADVPAADNNGVMLAEDEDVSRRRHRRARRRQAIEDEISPYLGDNAPIITSNVPIAPMTFMHDENTQFSSDESLRKARENQIAQEITQELPAVAMRKSSRRVRKSRSDRPLGTEQNVDAEIAQLVVEPAIEAIHEIAESSDPRPDSVSNRRVRRTRRDRLGEPETQRDISDLTMLPNLDFIRSDSERLPQNMIKPQSDVPTSATSEVSSEPVAAVRQGERRVRRTRRRESQDFSDVSDISPIAEAIEKSQPVASAPMIDEVPAPVEVLHPSSEENRSTRRVRRVRAAKSGINAPIEQEQPVAAPAQISVQPQTPVVTESVSLSSENEDDSIISVRRSHRTRRRTRRFSMAEPRDDAEFNADSQDFAQDFEAPQEPAAQPEPREIPESEPSSGRSARRPRIRRSHRARLEDN